MGPKVKIAVLFLAALLGAAGQDFRKVAWGMTPAQVRATESARGEIAGSPGEVLLRYDSIRLGELDAQVLYFFANDRLIRAKYVFTAEHADLNEFIRDFRAVTPLLVDKHGKPALDRAIWEDDSTQLEPKSYLDQDRASPANILPSDPNVGLAVSLGHLRLLSQWETARTRVSHLLAGQDHRITHQIEYRSAEVAAKEPKP